MRLRREVDSVRIGVGNRHGDCFGDYLGTGSRAELDCVACSLRSIQLDDSTFNGCDGTGEETLISSGLCSTR